MRGEARDEAVQGGQGQGGGNGPASGQDQPTLLLVTAPVQPARCRRHGVMDLKTGTVASWI
jgi:hypothetical protein